VLLLICDRSLVINTVDAQAQASTIPICVCFLFIRYSDNTKFTLRDLLEVLVKQTIERHPAALPLCKDVYARHIQEDTEPSAKELIGLLKRVTSELMASTYYFLDALDEAPADVQLELLQSLTALNVRLFVTSRPLKTLEAQFPEAFHFPIVAQDSDLDIHIDKELSRSSELQDILAKATPGLEGKITLIIKRKCSGM
jgi:ankyrin repeat domain-containing protein 50